MRLPSSRLIYEELTDWNQRMNLTAITEYDKVQINHFLDSLTVASVWKPTAKDPSQSHRYRHRSRCTGNPPEDCFPQDKIDANGFDK